jgi:hypothetical protein
MNDRVSSRRVVATSWIGIGAIATMVVAIGALGAVGSISAPVRSTKPPAAAANAALFADKGKLKISVNGQLAATEEFEIHPNGEHWIAQSTVELKPAQGPASHVHAHLTLQPDGTPVAYTWSTDGSKKASANIQFQNSIATIVLQIENAKPFTQQFTFTSPQIAILDNNVYQQYGVLADLYDRAKKGVQTFSVLVPQEMIPGTVTVESMGSATVAGAETEQLRVKTADLELDVYVDAKGRLMRIVVPSANAEITRE